MGLLVPDMDSMIPTPFFILNKKSGKKGENFPPYGFLEPGSLSSDPGSVMS